MTRIELLDYLSNLLRPENVRDYCPNGLQVEGKLIINKVITGVTATQALIDQAIAKQADALFVHHGYFWKSESPCIEGMKKKRIKSLLEHDINLFAYHLPLDIHPEYGNNAQLARVLEIKIDGGLDPTDRNSVAVAGHLTAPLSLEAFSHKIEQRLARKPLCISGGDHPIRTIAWCTGGGQGYIEQAARQGFDAFLSGEISEQTVHTAKEMNIHYVSAGHHATERYGAQAVGLHLAEKFGLQVEFVDIDNPV